KQFEALRSVDDGIGSLESELQAEGRLQNTLWVFLSDQGIEIGEHRLLGKDVPYEEAIRTPLIMRWDGGNWALGTNSALVANVDLAPTIAEAAGTTMPGAEGMNLLPVLADPSTPWRQEMLLEHMGGKARPSFCGVRTPDFTYVQY